MCHEGPKLPQDGQGPRQELPRRPPSRPGLRDQQEEPAHEGTSGLKRPASLLAVLLLSCPAGRARADDALNDLFAHLAAATSRGQAASLEQRIEAAEEKPISPTARVLVDGGNAALVAGQTDKAVQDLDSAIDLQPDLGILYRERAVMRLHSGDVAGSIDDLGHAIDREPRDFQAWSILSEVTESKGDAQAAYAAWRKVLAIDPRSEDAGKRLDQLRRKALGEPA